VTDNPLQILLDKQALDELIYTQAMALDAQDWETYRSCFADKINFDFSEHVERAVGQKIGAATDPDEWVANSASVIPGFDSTMHTIASPVHLLRGDTARSRCYIIAEHFLNDVGGDRSTTSSGLYTFDSIRTSDGWKIKNWQLKVLYYRGNLSLYRVAAERVRLGLASTRRDGSPKSA
jgi:SnoaL-like domain